MAGLDNICEKIISDAKVKADEIVLKAEKQSALIKAEGESKRAKIKEETDRILADGEREHKERITALLLAREREELLKTENDTIKEIILEAKNRMENLSKTEYFDLLEAIYKLNAEDSDGELLLTKEDRERMDKDFPERLSKIRGSVKLSDETINKKGFIIRYGRILLNCTFDAIFEDKQNTFFDIAAACLKG